MRDLGLLLLALSFPLYSNAHDGKGKKGGGTPVGVCKKYAPGQARVAFADIYGGDGGAGLIRTSGADRTPATVNAAMEPELTPAILDVMSATDSKVYLGGYDDVTGTHASADGLEGIRVIFEKEYTVGDKKRLVTVITSWRRDDAGKLVFTGGPDSIRVRAQVDDTEPPGHFLALSYATTMRDGKVSDIRPGEYVRRSNDEGKYWVEDAHGARTALQARVGQCNSCHGAGLRRNTFHTRGPTMAEMLEGRTEIPERYTELLKKVTDLRSTFRPPGIVEALKKRCEGVFK